MYCQTRHSLSIIIFMEANSNKSAGNNRKLLVFSSILVIFTLFLTLYSFFSNYGLTDDEGFYLYFLIHGIAETSFTFFHTGIHFIGEAFNHNLIGYRIVNLILILTSINIAAYNSFLFYFRKNQNLNTNGSPLKLFLIFVNLCSLSFFSFIPTFSYTSAAIISANFWISSVFFYLNNKNEKEKWTLFMVIVALYFALVSRAQYFFPLLFLTPITFYLISKELNLKSFQLIKKLILAIILLGLVFAYLHIDFIYDIVPIASLLFSGSHQSLLGLYSEQIILFVTHKDFYIIYYSLAIILFYIKWKNLYFLKRVGGNIKKIHFFLIIIILIIFADLNEFHKVLLEVNGTPSDASHRIGRYFLALVVFVPMIVFIYDYIKTKLAKTKNKIIERDFILIYIICLVPSFISGFGTGSNIILWWSFALGSFSIPFVLLLVLFTDGFRKNIKYYIFSILLLWIGVNSIIYREQIYQFRRNGFQNEQTHYSKISPQLKYVKLDQRSSDLVDNLIKNLHSVNFDFKNDRIFSYPNLPGLVAVSGAKSFGEVWNQESSSKFRELKNIENKICAYVKLEDKVEGRRVYLLIKGNLPKNLSKCLEEKIVLTQSSNEIIVGEIKEIPMVYNDFTENIGKVRLLGPFYLK